MTRIIASVSIYFLSVMCVYAESVIRYNDPGGAYAIDISDEWAALGDKLSSVFSSPDASIIIGIQQSTIDVPPSFQQLIEDFFEGLGAGSEWSGRQTNISVLRVKRWNADSGAQGFSSRMIERGRNCLLYVAVKGDRCFYLSIDFEAGDADALKKAEAVIDSFRLKSRGR